jgi:hypothetical protein
MAKETTKTTETVEKPKETGAILSKLTPEKDYYIFKLVDSKRKVHIMPNESMGVNPKTGKREKIYCIDGVDSIWYSDLIETLKDKTFVNNHMSELKFYYGKMKVFEHETNKIEFLRHCEYIIDNPSRRTRGSINEFFEYDPEKAQREANERENRKLQLVIKASQTPIEQVREHAAYLGINFIDAEFGLKKSDETIIMEYAKKAQDNPDLFEKSLGSKEVSVSYKIRNAIIDGKIDVGRGDNKAYYAGGGLICFVPEGKKALDVLTELALTNTDEGQKFAQTLGLL